MGGIGTSPVDFGSRAVGVDKCHIPVGEAVGMAYLAYHDHAAVGSGRAAAGIVLEVAVG